VGVSDGIGVSDGMGVSVEVGVIEGVRVMVGVGVIVGVGVKVGVGVGDGGTVGVKVGVGVGGLPAQSALPETPCPSENVTLMEMAAKAGPVKGPMADEAKGGPPVGAVAPLMGTGARPSMV
jgi:hypothetical protein